MPWAAKSLGKIKNFELSPDIIRGFEHVLTIEKMSPSKERRKEQLKHLLAIADHEQRRVLQPLIYNDPDFNKWTARERWWWVRLMAPKYELVFTHECTTDDAQLKSVAPDDLIVENEKSRMKWIADAAQQFHRLMDEQANHMTKELNIIAGWKDSPDALLVY